MTNDYKEKMKLKNQLCFPLYAAARKVVSFYTPYLKPHGLTYTQYIVFLALWEKDGVMVGELGNKLMLDCGTLSPLLKKMEKEGYVARRRDKTDDRVVLVFLTKKGRDLQERIKDVPDSVGRCVDLTEQKAGELYSLLYEFLGNK